ncbi:dihydroorotate dehydrogenase electron transfer subunit [Mangrovibacillus cuniculi]|uniref:Dihydroorotate dehydrogenase B (NAD(+)), electron transfer subunit n=1 Tax=Mangrovibacillus cuniculi TaxID=2593652 RepID=A0A7S8HEZ8_9BACI|nr:dihydroorotate dehydrogenase electron transfer subunit [Mangrovibacillus cuniculi]QPC46283.1 dihydroorotate dehydrogenase electron transfer subunit [Mangrovibacillus cuniculi]
MRKEWMKVVQKLWRTENIVELTLEGELVEEVERPGQFLHVATGEKHVLRRPISIASYDKNNCQLTIIFRVEGKGTKWLSLLSKGDLVDVMGPLGNGFDISRVPLHAEVLVIGGGIGVPPLYGVASEFKKRNLVTKHILGFSSKQDAFLLNEFQKLGETFLTTVDGSLGQKGFVTDVTLPTPDYVFSCGPSVMLRAVKEKYSNSVTYLSLEDRMGCGIGICYACVCSSNHAAHDKKVCVDGPVFLANEVVLT